MALFVVILVFKKEAFGCFLLYTFCLGRCLIVKGLLRLVYWMGLFDVQIALLICLYFLSITTQTHVNIVLKLVKLTTKMSIFDVIPFLMNSRFLYIFKIRRWDHLHHSYSIGWLPKYDFWHNSFQDIYRKKVWTNSEWDRAQW